MSKLSIPKAVIKAMEIAGRPVTIKEIYDLILRHDLYHFGSDQPLNIVARAIRRHCENIEFGDAAREKFFIYYADHRAYGLITWKNQNQTVAQQSIEISKEIDIRRDLLQLHEKYVEHFQGALLDQIKSLDPSSFEMFSKKILEEYGFSDMQVTQKSKDGGIDGYGKLKVGLAELRVAFQSKRWKKSAVGRQAIDQFRGAIQGKYEQGYFFTTSSFTKEAQEASFQAGAVPIILIDGISLIKLMLNNLIKLMLNKQIGVELKHLPIYSNALDLLVADSDEPSITDS